MDINQAKEKFYNSNPNTLANFCYNEKLGSFLCFTFDYLDNKNTQVVSEAQKKQISDFAKKGNKTPLSALIEYYSTFVTKHDFIEKLSDFYYECVVNERSFKSTDEACDQFNAYMAKTNNTSTAKSRRSIVACYTVREDGTLDENRLFYMELTFGKTKNGLTVCKIENTFTEDEYKGAGIHSYGIRFLEAVLARRGVYTMIGESQACDVYDSESEKTLEDHYRKLGFNVVCKNGTNYITKDVDPCFEMQLSGEKTYEK